MESNPLFSFFGRNGNGFVLYSEDGKRLGLRRKAADYVSGSRIWKRAQNGV